MSDILISALHANEVRHNNAASNVANVNTRDYKSLRTTLTNDAGGNVYAATERSTTEGILTDDGHFTSNVDLPQEFTDMILVQRGFEAILCAISTREKMMSDLMNALTDLPG